MSLLKVSGLGKSVGGVKAVDGIHFELAAGELLALGGRYRELYERQHSIETDRFINPGEDHSAVSASASASAGPAPCAKPAG